MDRILHYEIVRELGEGKNGRTFLAMDTGLQRAVVVKLLEKSETHSADWITRLRDEVRRCDELDDERVARFYSWDEVNGRPFVVREFVDGKSLAELAVNSSLDYHRFLELALSSVQALENLHGQNAVHGNLSAANMIVDARDQIRLVDPGLGVEGSIDGSVAHLSPEDLAYLAPEQWRGEPITPQTDFYALGVILYHLLTGGYPHYDDNPDRLRKMVVGESALADEEKSVRIPGVARLLIAKLLSRSPRERFVSTEELTLTIQGMMSLGADRPPLSKKKRWYPSARQWLLFPVLFMLLLILWLVITSDQP
jgi:serine/threonine-protein kinase